MKVQKLLKIVQINLIQKTVIMWLTVMTVERKKKSLEDMLGSSRRE